MEFTILSNLKCQNSKMKRRGSVSIYLAIVFLSIVLLVCAVAEAARVNAVQSKDKAVTMMAADSVIAGYAKQVYDDYGILLVWNKESLDETLSKYIQANIKMADIEVSGNDFLGSDLQEVSVTKKVYATDNGGDAFVKQVSEYLKYAGLKSAIDKLLKNSKEIKEDDSKQSVSDDITDKSYDKLANLVDEIDSLIKRISDTEELSNLNSKVNGIIENKPEQWKKLDKKLIKEIYKYYEKISKTIKNKESDIDKATSKIESYLEKKTVLLKKNNYKESAKDYMDENLTVLKKIKDKVQIIKRFEYASGVSGNPNAEQFINVSMQLEEYFKDLQVAKITEKDKQNKSIFDSAKDIFDKGVLSLVIKDTSKLSTASVNTSSLPSQTSMSKSLESSSLYDKAAVGVYSNIYFGNYVNEKKKNALKYGLEYLVAGKDSDKSNLSSVVKRLVAIRHLPNYACILKDAAKKAEIETIAMSIAAVTGLPFLEPVAKAILTEAWVLAESVNDVKILLAGEKLSLVKTEANWKTSLRNLFGGNTKGDDSGFKYEIYLGLLLTITDRDDVVYRTMDLIQMNICKNYNKEFRMNKGLMSFKSDITYDIAPLFTAMPWTVGMLSDSGSYKFNVECNNGY